MSAIGTRARSGGFSLVEVMVAVIVICVGLMGIAKMQALSLSNSTTSRLRSLAAIEAASLASIMHSNRLYWASATLPPNFTATVTVGGIASNDAALQAQAAAYLGTAPNINACLGAQCTPVQLAAFDLARWSVSLNGAGATPGLLPNAVGTVNCPPAPAGLNTPVSCTIVITWSEKAVAVNRQSSTAAANAACTAAVAAGQQCLQIPTYTLYVEP